VLSGSAALLLTFIEPLNGYSRSLPVSEQRFRIGFVAVYGVLVAVSILGPEAANPTVEEARRLDLMRSACALIGLAAVAASIWFRGRHPLEAKARKATRRVATTEDEALAARLLDLVRRDEVHGDPDLRVTDLAVRLGQPEYRVSQCISSVLGFDNFNRLINHHRIARARRLLADPTCTRPILNVAFDCGFASIGPFNRAFKVETGMTPRAFRATRAQAPE
jgi:AraC-like DNA-binding protein